tara:strand:- start:519 stop:653 length:135 start_codon:yes stop_codon:yes gene_type:complete
MLVLKGQMTNRTEESEGEIRESKHSRGNQLNLVGFGHLELLIGM